MNDDEMLNICLMKWLASYYHPPSPLNWDEVQAARWVEEASSGHADKAERPSMEYIARALLFSLDGGDRFNGATAFYQKQQPRLETWKHAETKKTFIFYAIFNQMQKTRICYFLTDAKSGLFLHVVARD